MIKIVLKKCEFSASVRLGPAVKASWRKGGQASGSADARAVR